MTNCGTIGIFYPEVWDLLSCPCFLDTDLELIPGYGRTFLSRDVEDLKLDGGSEAF